MCSTCNKKERKRQASIQASFDRDHIKVETSGVGLAKKFPHYKSILFLAKSKKPSKSVETQNQSLQTLIEVDDTAECKKRQKKYIVSKSNDNMHRQQKISKSSKEVHDVLSVKCDSTKYKDRLQFYEMLIDHVIKIPEKKDLIFRGAI